jgi:hypothetical protein
MNRRPPCAAAPRCAINQEGSVERVLIPLSARTSRRPRAGTATTAAEPGRLPPRDGNPNAPYGETTPAPKATLGAHAAPSKRRSISKLARPTGGRSRPVADPGDWRRAAVSRVRHRNGVRRDAGRDCSPTESQACSPRSSQPADALQFRSTGGPGAHWQRKNRR